MVRILEDTCTKPEEGWSGPDDRGHLRYTMHGRSDQHAPARTGYDAFFVAVHGANFTTWTYRPVKQGAAHV